MPLAAIEEHEDDLLIFTAYLVQAVSRPGNTAPAVLCGYHTAHCATFMCNRPFFEMRKSKPGWLKDRSPMDNGSGLPSWPPYPAWPCLPVR